ncbi:type II/IV secretion system protein [Candidatus Sumerlaeota bacterium]|nr:type II/IV secretion system protein [Candidatus Sumerlaeota bacterium]
MLNAVSPPIDALIERLEEAEVVEEGRLGEAVEEAGEMGENPYEWIVRQGLLSPDVLKRFLNSPANPLVQRCAFFMAVAILEYNRLLGSKEADRLAKKVYHGQMDSAVSEAKKMLKLTPAKLLAKIEEGLYLPDIAPSDMTVDPELLDFFPVGLVRRQTFMPISRDAHHIVVAIADPLNVNLAVLVRWILGKWMQPLFVPAGVLVDRINEEYQGAGEGVSGDGSALARPGKASSPKSSSARAGASGRKKKSPAKGKRAVAASKKAAAASKKARGGDGKRPVMDLGGSEAPVDSLSAVQLVSSLIERAIDLGATDIHLEPGRTSMKVRFRIDGLLNKILDVPRDMVAPVTSRVKVLANMDVTERRRPQDGHIMLEMGGRHFDFRIATMPTVYGEKVAIRILDSARVMTGMEDLGLNENQRKLMDSLLRHPFGVILVTGPTGSGKTSTLYAALNGLNQEDRHLVTIEDPVEYKLDGINQVQVEAHIGLTFSEGLRAILRQDPNVIMVGEIRDPDTARTAIRAAMTGHLVFSTLHTNTALGAIQALTSLGTTPYMIGSALTGLIAQRLVRKLCTKCSKTKAMDKATALQLGLPASSKMRLRRPVGCDACLQTGYSGRIGIFEIIEMTDRLREAVLKEESPDKIQDLADKEGRISIQAAGLEKIKEGVTSPEEVIKKIILDT